MKFCFGDIVIVDDCYIGVIVRSWVDMKDNGHNYDVYVRVRNSIMNYKEEDIERYMVRHKCLDEEELMYQHDTVNQ